MEIVAAIILPIISLSSRGLTAGSQRLLDPAVKPRDDDIFRYKVFAFSKDKSLNNKR